MSENRGSQTLTEKRAAAAEYALELAVQQLAGQNPLGAYLAALVQSDLTTPQETRPILTLSAIEAAPQAEPQPIPAAEPPVTEEAQATPGELAYKAARQYIFRQGQIGEPIDPKMVALFLGTEDSTAVRKLMLEVQDELREQQKARERQRTKELQGWTNSEPPPVKEKRPAVVAQRPRYFDEPREKRFCKNPACGKELVPRKDPFESKQNFFQRVTCDRNCAHAMRKAGA